ncbi:hypothetical protein KVV02_002371 [Mortierella alpina]|uniref:Tyrosine specific protein phosphatases domain-containing protein n=1 Tax=Mortierella alpina TaxID=64518 RepID=A0A9P8CWW0_MORAP|nr:hypothetical protein KVV02_002371 [Mortierella alpina]
MGDAHAAVHEVTPPTIRRESAAGTTIAGANTDSPGTSSVSERGALEEDTAGSSHAMTLPPHQSLLDLVAYTVSLNYNRIATSRVLSPLTRWHWYDPIPHTPLILGALPSEHQLVHMQRYDKVQYIINMCAEFPGHSGTMSRLGLIQCWIPTRDFHTPSVDSIWRGVQFIEKFETGCSALPQSERGTIYLHCKAGRGRSATVALCWLVYTYSLTTIEAQRILLRARGQASDSSRAEISFAGQCILPSRPCTRTLVWLFRLTRISTCTLKSSRSTRKSRNRRPTTASLARRGQKVCHDMTTSRDPLLHMDVVRSWTLTKDIIVYPAPFANMHERIQT